MVGQAGPKPHRASNGVRERFRFWALHLSFRHSLAITELAEPHHSLIVHCLIFLSSIFYCNTHSGQRLGLGFGDSGASPKTLNPDGNTGSSAGEGLARDQDSSQPTRGPVDDLPPSHGSSDTPTMIPVNSPTRSHHSDADNGSNLLFTVDKVRQDLLSSSERLLPHHHLTNNTTFSSTVNPYPDTSNPSRLSTSGHGLTPWIAFPSLFLESNTAHSFLCGKETRHC